MWCFFLIDDITTPTKVVLSCFGLLVGLWQYTSLIQQHLNLFIYLTQSSLDICRIYIVLLRLALISDMNLQKCRLLKSFNLQKITTRWHSWSHCSYVLTEPGYSGPVPMHIIEFIF